MYEFKLRGVDVRIYKCVDAKLEAFKWWGHVEQLLDSVGRCCLQWCLAGASIYCCGCMWNWLRLERSSMNRKHEDL